MMARRQVVIKLEWHGDGLLDRIRRNQEAALLEAATMLKEAAQAKAPVDTGKLRDSAYVRTPDKSTYRRAAVHRKEAPIEKGQALMGFAAFYAIMIEKGTKFAAAKPFIRPAFDELKNSMGKKVASELGKAVDK